MRALYDARARSDAAIDVEVLDSDNLEEEPPREAEARTSRSAPSSDRDRAFRALYDAHAAFVWRNLRRLGVAPSDVEDKVQEVFVVAHRRWADFADRGHGPRAWLFQILLRVASDARRHRRRHPVDPDGGTAQDREAIDAPQTAAVARREALDLLDRALSTIDLGRRAVLVLHEIEQMTAPEISKTLEIPLNTVYSRLRVARVELEQELVRIAGDDARGPSERRASKEGRQ